MISNRRPFYIMRLEAKALEDQTCVARNGVVGNVLNFSVCLENLLFKFVSKRRKKTTTSQMTPLKFQSQFEEVYFAHEKMFSLIIANAKSIFENSMTARFDVDRSLDLH